MNKKKVIASTSIASAIIASVIGLEGVYSNDPYDLGGETKYGITERVAREYGYTGSMKDLSLETANKIYSSLYIYEPNFDRFIDINPAIAHKLIDAGVNVGTSRVSIWLQESINLYSRDGQDYSKIREDGVIGEKTIKAYQALENKRGKEKACTLILKALDGHQIAHYASLTSYSRYIVGWVDKRIQNIPLNQCREYTLLPPLELQINESK